MRGVSSSRNYLVVLGCLLAAILYIGPVTGSKRCRDSGMSDENGLYTPSSCKKFTLNFLQAYENGIDHKTKLISMCKLYQKLRDCILEHFQVCSHRQEHLHHWEVIHDFMQPLCINKSREHIKEWRCLRKHQNNKLVTRCADLFTFKQKQGIYNQCMLINEAVSCKQHMLDSACGSKIGNLVFHLEKINMTSQYDPKCGFKKTRRQGFVFTKKCPTDLYQQIQYCFEDHVEDRIKFSRTFNLVAESDVKKLKKACRRFDRYHQCISSLKDSCPEGVAMVYQVNGYIRTTLHKFHHICGEHKSDYMANVACYREVTSEAMKSCAQKWKEIRTNLEKPSQLTAFTFYCGRNGRSRHFHTLRRSLRQCYEDVFIDNCGEVAGRTMSRLISGMFYDPQFWRFGFRYYKNTDHTSKNMIEFKLFCNDVEVQRRNYATGKSHPEIPTKERSITVASPIKVTTTAVTPKARQKESNTDKDASYIDPNDSLLDANGTIDASRRAFGINPTQSSSTEDAHIEPTDGGLSDKMVNIDVANVQSERGIHHNKGHQKGHGEGVIAGSSDKQGHGKGQHVAGSSDKQSHESRGDTPQRDQDKISEKITDDDNNKNNNDNNNVSTIQHVDEFKDVEFIIRTDIKNEQHHEEKKRKNRRGNTEVVLQKDTELSSFHDDDDDDGSMVHAPSKDEFSSKYNGVDEPIDAHASYSSGSAIRLKSVSNFTLLVIIFQIIFYV